MDNTRGKVERHELAVKSAQSTINQLGLSCFLCSKNNCPFDLLVNAKVRIEVKVASVLQKSKSTEIKKWVFNLHRHGVLQDGKADFYVLYFPPIPVLGMKSSIPLVIPANQLEGMSAIRITPKTLMFKWGRYWNGWQAIKKSASKLG